MRQERRQHQQSTVVYKSDWKQRKEEIELLWRQEREGKGNWDREKTRLAIAVAKSEWKERTEETESQGRKEKEREKETEKAAPTIYCSNSTATAHRQAAYRDHMSTQVV